MSWTEKDKLAVWGKGTKITGYDPDKYRKDECGAWIQFDQYGNRNSETNYGWEIDHISPGGENELSNLRPLHWKNNLEKSDGRLKGNVRSDGNHNIYNN